LGGEDLQGRDHLDDLKGRDHLEDLGVGGRIILNGS